MKLYSREEARHMLCRYHNLDGAEAISGEIGVEKIMQRIHSIQYDPLRESLNQRSSKNIRIL